jgi:hypothetical protein
MLSFMDWIQKLKTRKGNKYERSVSQASPVIRNQDQ